MCFFVKTIGYQEGRLADSRVSLVGEGSLEEGIVGESRPLL